MERTGGAVTTALDRGGEPAEGSRLAVVGLLGSSVVAGLLFTPVFGLGTLALPVLSPAIAGYAGFEICRRWLSSWRPLLVLVLGVLGLFAAVPGTTAATLVRGVTEGWLRTLQSTWPARPDADQLLFVPILVLLAVMVGLEVLLRLKKPAVALLPSLLVAMLAQAYQALTGLTAMLAALAYLAPAALSLWTARPGRRRFSGSGAVLALSTVVTIVAGVAAVGSLDPVGNAPYRLADSHPAPPPQTGISNPLNEIASRLMHPGQEVFRYRTDAPVDRWRLVVLDGFDGAGWSADTNLRRLGVGPDGNGAAVNTADVRVDGLSGPWLPSQQNLVSVAGADPLVDETAETLLAQGNEQAGYRLSWSAPPLPADLGAARVDTQAPGGLGALGVVPDDISQLAWHAVRGLRPSFQAALQLERFLRENYRVVDGGTPPTGDGWPQLREFLTRTKAGTSEQFAAAYVVLARITGIPARLAVGYRGSAETVDGFHVVRNKDVLAWPEVAVSGVGFVPLDPTSGADRTDRPQSALSQAAAQARAQLPPENQLQPQTPIPPDASGDQVTSAGSNVSWAVAIGVAALLLCWLLGVPLAKALRTHRRRRRNGTDGVLGAWAEARDLLVAHRIPYRAGMTPRDLAATAGTPIEEPLLGLAQVLDWALWSRIPVNDDAPRHAWAAVRAIRRSLARRPFRERLRAALEARTLLRSRRS
ncbi:transglutaminaseTgpA domain-containing protein [Amycolatopsis sp.]|uniref:transglutaminase family protein n=1 Tax=Amycolatopsis sp. TaxID=37632 RepID=UPI002D803BE0|nr:transglutaminaseTgpA domain-containing protein [Amycolatopsis sp.]